MAPREPEDPQRVGPYRILGRLGSGGMGVVFAATNGDGTCVAVKLIHAEHATDTDFRARFTREVELMRRVAGVCAVAVLDADTGARRPWLATPYVAGPTLRDHIRAHGPLTGGMLTGFAAGVAEALAAIHRAGIVHRDLKPANVLLSPQGPQVLDFGIARAADESGLTRTGGLVGSPGWISPEQYRGQAAGPPADVFAWGALVAYAATGRPPFGTGAVDVLAFRVLQAPPDLAGIGEPLHGLLLAAMNKTPEHRPSAEQLLAALTTPWQNQHTPPHPEDGTQVLTRLLHHEWTTPAPARSRPVPHQHPASRPRREPLLTPGVIATGLALLLFALAAGTGAGLLMREHDTDQAQEPGTRPTAETVTATGEPTRAAEDTSVEPLAEEEASAPPTTDPAGFTVLVPRDWTREVEQNSVFYRSPDGDSYLQVDFTPHTTDDEYRHVIELEENALRAGNLTGYERVRVEDVTFGTDYLSAAEWEFTWVRGGQQRRFLSRNIAVTHGRHVTVAWAAPTAVWADQTREREAALASFTPLASFDPP
nr:serine/threonine-protein kinase [Thermobifida halotolerans]